MCGISGWIRFDRDPDGAVARVRIEVVLHECRAGRTGATPHTDTDNLDVTVSAVRDMLGNILIQQGRAGCAQE
ncbi:hypothetical protein [Streptomyces sp. NPDC029674]|uniref:hypothetical protein n=1 Tax=Streptomyces sp. NPDC029674 TaxID=3365297 RepID=UPI00384BB01D